MRGHVGSSARVIHGSVACVGDAVGIEPGAGPARGGLF
jgi:hypothetical protein